MIESAQLGPRRVGERAKGVLNIVLKGVLKDVLKGVLKGVLEVDSASSRQL